jgi:Pvc16 N-terminal domain
VSNSLAIATVTTALSDLLVEATVESNVSMNTVTTQRPGEAGWDSGAANLFLYAVEPNGAWRNDDLPTRSEDGTVVRRPQVALTLNYLMTFFGDIAQMEPQRLLGTVVGRLHSRPILTREAAGDVVAAHPTFLAGSDLQNQIELVRFTLEPLGIDELSKLWSVFPQASYGLSLAYQGSVVLIDAEEVVEPPLPVLARDFRGTPFRQPLIESVTASAGAQAPIVAGETLVVTGTQLAGDITRLRIGTRDFVPASERDTQLTLPVPEDLPAGVLGAQVVQLMALGDPPVPHSGVESNIAGFVLRPTVEHFSSVKVGAATDVTVTFRPIVRTGQRASLLLNDQPGRGGHAFRVDGDPVIADADQLTFTVEGPPAGMYVLRVQVDGAQSPIALVAGRWTPEVSIL